MLRLSKSSAEKSRNFEANLLPCRIELDEEVPVAPRYWTPEKLEDGSSEVYFRGRRLKGKQVQLPPSYEGIVVTRGSTTPANGQKTTSERHDIDESSLETTAEPLLQQATFDSVMVWDHEKMPELDDKFVCGISEWIAFAEVMHRVTPQAVGQI